MTSHLRRIGTLTLAALLSGGIASCGGGSANAPAETQQTRPLAGGGRSTVGPAAAQAQRAAAPGLTIPEDARWTVFCATFTGPDHALQARTLCDRLKRDSGLRDWYLISGEGRTTLYHGYYRAIDPDDKADGAEGRRAQADRKAVQGIFRGAFLVELDADDPSSPPEWNLTRTPPRMLYTVQVGVYKDHPDRRAAAVQAVREARARGIPAFYYHGPTGSSVCIGVWPEEAVKENNKLKFAAPAEMADEVPVVVPAGVAIKEGAVSRDGRPLSVVKPTIEVTDPTLLATLRQYDTHAINGIGERKVMDPRTGQTRTVRQPSFIVRIPERLTREERLVAAQQRFRKNQATEEDLIILEAHAAGRPIPDPRPVASTVQPTPGPAAPAGDPGGAGTATVPPAAPRPPILIQGDKPTGGRLKSLDD